ncbi:hypothetical protein CLV51_1021228 [Chitinophaga niastensis]|uniref:Uncharacterized protein n=1 Tax=Chitinophaga niastensis TaxID=536980 RepID=A0A2P8HQ64_CHINA|nr:hypothetical protein CLV51_1021228 [Chitinophaga niastensis]
MKKAKIMLTAIIILAVVGGTLAFRIKAPIRYYMEDSSQQCTVPTYLQLTTRACSYPNVFLTRLNTAPSQTRCSQVCVQTIQ